MQHALLASASLDANAVLAGLGYLASILMFMLGIMKMGKVKTARSGNLLAAGAMLVAVLAQFVEMGAINPIWILAGMVVGTAIGGVAAWRVKMTEMPELVALFNGVGGLASTLVALSYFGFEGGVRAEVAEKLKEMSHQGLNAEALQVAKGMSIDATSGAAGTMLDYLPFHGQLGEMAIHVSGIGTVSAVALVLSIIIGAVTFTGSVVAFLKLSEKIDGKAKLFPMHHGITFMLLASALVLGGLGIFMASGFTAALLLMIAVTILTLGLGYMLVMPIGGGDMPVVISLLNSYSGVAAAMAGFAINSPVLIVSGSLVGASGLILTKIMCKAMNRSLTNVLFGGFGAEAPAASGGGGKQEYVGVKNTDAESAAMMFEDAQSCIIVPGYGMAVAQAQHAVRELGELLEARGCKVRYAIHPVAGRMPGHMNVLLAEANVPYEQLFEMDQINSDFKNTDVALVIGANDVVNPAAKDDPSSPIYGMPVLNVEEARTVYVIKRSLGSGFAGIKNELFEKPNTTMLFGDGRGMVEDISKALKEAK